MKTQTTIKKIKNDWGKIFYCGYCDLQEIYYGKEAQYFNAGIYGWNCDIYCDYGRDIAIMTGYRKMAGKKIPNKLIKKYTEIAKEIIYAPYKEYTYEEQKELLNDNVENFLDELNNL